MSARPLRVLHLHTGNIFGGVESILLSLVRHGPLCPGLEWRFGLCFEGAFSRELAAAGAPVAMLPVTRFSRPWTLFQTRSAALRLLGELCPDVCITHSTWTQSVFGPVCRRAGVPQVLWMHSSIPGSKWIRLLAQGSPPDALLCVSRDTERHRQNLFASVPSEVIYTPLPYRSLHAEVAPREQTRAALGAHSGQTVIIQVSRLEAWKGHKVLLQALARLRERPDWVCWQVGGMDRPEEQIYFEELQTLAASLGIKDRVKFLGRRNDVPSLLAAADIYCQANLDTEGFSIAFLEACLAKLPLVTTDIGSASEIVGADNGVLVPVGDDAALAGALNQLTGSPETRRKLGEGSFAKAFRLCDPSRQMGALEAFFRKVSTARS